jgi:hypothetical protein
MTDDLREIQEAANAKFRGEFENQSLGRKIEQQEAELRVDKDKADAALLSLEDIKSVLGDDTDWTGSEDLILELFGQVEAVVEDAVGEINEGVVTDAVSGNPPDIQVVPDDQTMLRDKPFEILVDSTQDPPAFFVCQGGFYDVDTFKGTDGSSSFGAFSLYPANTSFSSGSVWAVLKINSDGEWDSAELASSAGTAPSGGRVLNVLIGKIGTDGSATQFVTGHISVGSGEFEIQPTIGLFKVVAARAYDSESGTLIAHDVEFNSGTMDLKPTWDWVRWP